MVKFLGVQISKGDGPQYTQISTTNMYKFINISHYILIQWHGNYKEMKKINDMLETVILEKSSQIFWGVLRGGLQGFGCQKRHPDTLLAKTKVEIAWN